MLNCHVIDGKEYCQDIEKYGDKWLITEENDDNSRKVYIAEALDTGVYKTLQIGHLSEQDVIDIDNGTKYLDFDKAFINKEIGFTGSSTPSTTDDADNSFNINLTDTQKVVIGVAGVAVIAGVVLVFVPGTIPATLAVGRGILTAILRNAGKNAAGEITKKSAGNNLDKIIGTATGVLVGTTNSFADAEALTITRPPVDPLILDLDGDGIETTTIGDGIYFDHETDGFAEKTSWVGADDGLIVNDLNHDGVINDGSELIKTFSDLSAYDSNSDGKIDINDAEFANLKILKGDGTIMTMDEAGIKSIDLNYTTTDTTDENGNQQIALRKAA